METVLVEGAGGPIEVAVADAGPLGVLAPSLGHLDGRTVERVIIHATITGDTLAIVTAAGTNPTAVSP